MNPGDRLALEVYVPSAEKPVHMEGEVRWCQEVPDQKSGGGPVFETGVKVFIVENTFVEKSIFIDQIHNVMWSVVLESIFGNFKHLMLKRKQPPNA